MNRRPVLYFHFFVRRVLAIGVGSNPGMLTCIRTSLKSSVVNISFECRGRLTMRTRGHFTGSMLVKSTMVVSLFVNANKKYSTVALYHLCHRLHTYATVAALMRPSPRTCHRRHAYATIAALILPPSPATLMPPSPRLCVPPWPRLLCHRHRGYCATVATHTMPPSPSLCHRHHAFLCHRHHAYICSSRPAYANVAVVMRPSPCLFYCRRAQATVTLSCTTVAAFAMPPSPRLCRRRRAYPPSARILDHHRLLLLSTSPRLCHRHRANVCHRRRSYEPLPFLIPPSLFLLPSSPRLLCHRRRAASLTNRKTNVAGDDYSNCTARCWGDGFSGADASPVNFITSR